MRSRTTYTVAAITIGFAAIVAAQGVPSAPKNLRIVTGTSTPTPPPPPCVVPPPSGGAHAYFDALVRRAEHLCNWSLRTQAQLNALTADPVATYFTYAPAVDSHSHKQDAAKLEKTQFDRYHTCNLVNGFVTFTGTPGTVIPKLHTLTRPSDGAVYRTTSAYTIPSSGVTANSRVDAYSPNSYLAEAASGTVLNVAPLTGLGSTATVELGETSGRIKVRCSDSVPIQQQLRMPIGISSGTVLITWDFYFTPDWRTNIGALPAYKMFKIQSGTGLGVSGGWWTLLTHLAKRSSDSRTIGSHHEGIGFSPTEGIVSTKPFNPTGLGAQPSNTYQEHHSVWTRYWVEIKTFQPREAFTEWSQSYLGGATLGANPDDAQGRWHMASVWIADENRDPVAVLYRAPLQWTGAGSIARFDFELNTSELPPAQTGPLVGYGRNVVVLHNYALPNVPLTDSLIFKRPGR